MTHCWNHKRAVRLLDLLEHGRMNVLRVWGEGHFSGQQVGKDHPVVDGDVLEIHT